MNIFALIPQILAGLELLDKIKTALAGGKGILQVLGELGTNMVEFFTEFAKTLFPNLGPEQQAAAGVTMFDRAATRITQTSMNRLQEASVITFGTALIVDGHYGPLTKAAVTEFQKKFNLEADGWSGRLTNAIRDVELAKLAAPVEMAKAIETQVEVAKAMEVPK